MKIQYLGFIPTIIAFIFLNVSTYIAIKKNWREDIAILPIFGAILSWLLLIAGCLFWALS